MFSEDRHFQRQDLLSNLTSRVAIVGPRGRGMRVTPCLLSLSLTLPKVRLGRPYRDDK